MRPGLLVRPLNELARSKPSDVMSPYRAYLIGNDGVITVVWILDARMMKPPKHAPNCSWMAMTWSYGTVRERSQSLRLPSQSLGV